MLFSLKACVLFSHYAEKYKYLKKLSIALNLRTNDSFSMRLINNQNFFRGPYKHPPLNFQALVLKLFLTIVRDNIYVPLHIIFKSEVTVYC